MKQVNTKYYARQLAARYPELPPEQILSLCQHLMKQLYVQVAVRHYDVVLQDRPRNLKVKIFKRVLDIPKANAIAKVKAARLKKKREERSKKS